MKKILGAFLVVLTLSGCMSEADVATKNMARAADNFEVFRRVVFYNGITGDYILSIEGYCSQNVMNDNRISVICRDGPHGFKRHFLGLSDNVTYFSEQLTPNNVSSDHYRVIFRPATILPEIEIQLP